MNNRIRVFYEFNSKGSSMPELTRLIRVVAETVRKVSEDPTLKVKITQTFKDNQPTRVGNKIITEGTKNA